MGFHLVDDELAGEANERTLVGVPITARRAPHEQVASVAGALPSLDRVFPFRLKFLGARGRFLRDLEALDRHRDARCCLHADGVEQLERAAL